MLIAAIGTLAVLFLGNLVLLFAVLRRLRQHEDKLALIGPPLDFDLTGLHGRKLTGLADGEPGSERLVGFFSAGCAACVEQARLFVRLDEPESVAIVLLTPADEAARRELMSALEGVPTVISEPDSRQIADDLGVSEFPVLLRVGADGTIVRAEHTLTALPARTASAR